MKEPKLFLSARWQDIILVTYDVEPELLLRHIPRGLEPDTIDGNGFVSLVAFDFVNTKVKGAKFPYHVNFPEINLRIYVKNKERRGVVFIREYVPRIMIQLIANNLYNENYKTAKMKSSVEKNGTIFLNHSIEIKNKKFEISLEADNQPYMPPADSTEHFFKEHEWGFGTSRGGRPLMYKVEHPFWNVYPIIKFHHNIDFCELYGREWESLNQKSPYNITYAQGSDIKVFSGQIIE